MRGRHLRGATSRTAVQHRAAEAVAADALEAVRACACAHT
jgi:hypothetical protein